jgi:quercetin dioxygenase-like cupin family protein
MDRRPDLRPADGSAQRATQLVDLGRVAGTGGVVWSVSPGGFHTNLVVLDAGGAIEPHRNDAVDVLVVVVAGSGTATVDGEAVDLAPNTALLLARGVRRGIAAGPGGLRYLTVHAERAPLGIGRRGDGDV